MNRILRKLTVLGQPPSTVLFSGLSKKIALSPNARILAATKDQSEILLSGPFGRQPTVIKQDLNSPDWAFNQENVIAQSLEDGVRSTVVAAHGGIYRVDIGLDSRFICDPTKVVGVQGDLQASIVYYETRLDVFSNRSKQIMSKIVSVSNKIINGTKGILSKIPIPQRVSKMITLPKSPLLSQQYRQRLLGWRFKLQAYRSSFAEFTYKAFHPPKIEIKGPCSLLLKP